ncbi:Uma2 family endonuclease [Nocardiopsis changdeensis]|uniref:Uma2 family endonuclease n=1 Tax=Nocardiopsis changdeensis TaxID=2831969 RepID=A0ABX8BP37_9ACTN|nr:MULTISPECIES: Uma2 family endonuclease [Nocardiopsis]QUX22148.1 Uma2 family endonuclease [Nocardiopsis changdeensis]QYX38088.1 Uma2 family endonuclease [Nocardiopsis sp. MT53]
MTAEPLPDWFMPPPGGWTADAMDDLPPGTPRMELIDGALIVMCPQTMFHGDAMWELANIFKKSAPEGIRVSMEMTTKLGKYQRPEPDVLVYRDSGEPAKERRRRTHVRPEDVLLVVEIVSPESRYRDHMIKPYRYADAGIPHFWRVEDEDGTTAIHVYELDETTKSYVPITIARGTLEITRPFPMTIDVQGLVD